ncbi:MAG: DedA family protein [Arenicellaceae bacterium]|nr:DedA family protein [Arenicellaceae bacterium]
MKIRIFEPIYRQVMVWSRYRLAPIYLGLISFAESSFFPIPVDVMLAPMVLAKRDAAWRFAFIATITSVLGGIVGYFIGMFLFDNMGQWLLDTYRAHDRFEQVQALFSEYGVWIVFIAGFTPIPYKVFTIASGVIGVALIPFIIASAFGRAGRFYLVSGLIYWGGPTIEKSLEKWVERIGWGTLLLIVLGLCIYKLA